MGRVSSVAAMLVLLAVGACTKKSPATDATAPTLTFSWIKTDGTQGTIQPGETASVTEAEAYTSNESIRVSARDDEGVKKMSLTWSGKGVCFVRDPVEDGTSFWGSPDPLTFQFPPLSKEAAAGQVLIAPVSLSLREELKKVKEGKGLSCGTHIYQGMSTSQEFFFDGGDATITVNAAAENCCGGETSATFTIDVK